MPEHPPAAAAAAASLPPDRSAASPPRSAPLRSAPQRPAALRCVADLESTHGMAGLRETHCVESYAGDSRGTHDAGTTQR